MGFIVQMFFGMWKDLICGTGELEHKGRANSIPPHINLVESEVFATRQRPAEKGLSRPLLLDPAAAVYFSFASLLRRNLFVYYEKKLAESSSV
jgi:hypothetical protein